MTPAPLRIIAEVPPVARALRTRLGALARRFYRGQGLPAGKTTHLILCSDATVRSLNARYRKKNAVTDVLSFAYGDQDLLGEVYIALPCAARQALRLGHPFDDEIERLLVHGMTHLLGHDHETPRQRARMEAVERRYTRLR